MERLLKFKKLFMLGLAAAVVAMFTPGCSDDDDDYIPGDDENQVTVLRTGYTPATVTGGGWYVDGEEVCVEVRNVPSVGYMITWVSDSPDVIFDNVTAPSTCFDMIDDDVTVTAEVKSDGYAYIRFSWEDEINFVDATSADLVINYVIASEDDIDDWYDDVFMDVMDEDMFMVDYVFVGNPAIPSNGLSNTIPKKVFFEVDDYEDGAEDDEDDYSRAWFTAIASFGDEDGDLFIVANYRIHFNGEAGEDVDDGVRYDVNADRFFTLEFDIEEAYAAALDHDYDVGEGEIWWMEVKNTPNTNTFFDKRRSRTTIRKVSEKVVSTDFGTMEVQQFVVRVAK